MTKVPYWQGYASPKAYATRNALENERAYQKACHDELASCRWSYIEDEQRGWIAHDTCLEHGEIREHVEGTEELDTRGTPYKTSHTAAGEYIDGLFWHPTGARERLGH